MTLQQLQSLPRPCQRKAGIIPVNRFAGVDAVFLYALSDLDATIEHGDVIELGDFLNRHLTASKGTGAEGGCNAADGFIIHDAPIDYHLSNFARYVREHSISADELKMMLRVAIGARIISGKATPFGVG